MTDTVVDVLEVNCETGETVERAFTPEEKARYEAGRLAALAEKEARQAEEARILALRESAKAKLIAGEPLTEEEAELIVL